MSAGSMRRRMVKQQEKQTRKEAREEATDDLRRITGAASPKELSLRSVDLLRTTVLRLMRRMQGGSHVEILDLPAGQFEVSIRRIEKKEK